MRGGGSLGSRLISTSMTSFPKLAELARDANVDFSEPLGTLSLVKARRPLVVNTTHREEAKRLVRLEAHGARTISLFHRHTAITQFRHKAEHIESALFHLVQDNGSAAVAQCLLDQFRKAQRADAKLQNSKLSKIPAGLLTYTAQHCAHRVDLVHLLAYSADVLELTRALEATIGTGNEELLLLLIHYGADQNQIQHSIKAAIVSEDRALTNVLLSGPTPLTKTTFETCLQAAIHANDITVLTFLLESPVVKRPALFESGLSWDRDGLLRLAIDTQQFRVVIAIAYHTTNQPLKDPSLYDATLRAGVTNVTCIVPTIQVLLGLDRDRCCDTFWANNFPPFVDERTMSEIVNLLISNKVMLSPAALRFAAARADLGLFLDVLSNNKVAGDEAWNLVDQLPISLQSEAREKILAKLLTPNILGGCWIQKALLYAVQAKKPYLVTHLLMRQANINHNDGEAVKAALYDRDEMIFKLLMTKQLSEAVLTTVLKSIGSFQKDLKLAFMSLVLKQNIASHVISPLLDEALCNFDKDRDLRLVRLLSDTKACCSPSSLVTLIDHFDIGVLQYLLTCRARGKEEDRVFVNGSMKFLAQKMAGIDDYRLRDTIFQIIDVHISALSKRADFRLAEYFDLREACHVGPIDSSLMKLFEKYQRLLPRGSRLEASAMIIRAQEPSLARMFIDSWAAEVAYGSRSLEWQDLSVMVRHLSAFHFEDDREKALKLGYMLRQFRLDDSEQDLRAECLELHIRSLARAHKQGTCWPLFSILELLQRQSLFDDRLHSCLKMASMYEQLPVIGHLLTIGGGSQAIGGDILRPLLRYNKTESLRFLIGRGLPLVVALKAFDFAEREGLHDLGTLLLKHATRHLHDGSCSCLKARICSHANEYASTLVRNYYFTSLEIDEFWQHLAMQPFEFEKHGLARLLLSRGLSLRLVQEALVCAAHSQDTEQCRLLLEQRAATPRNIGGLRSASAYDIPGGFKHQHSLTLNMLGPCSLHEVLKIAINTINVELCGLLLDRKAPIVFDRSFLLRQVMEKDSVPLLRTFLRHTSPAMTQRMLDESLWLATCLNKVELCVFLIEQGASPLAGNQRALKCAADRGLVDLLALFSLDKLPLHALESAFSRSQGTLLRMSIPHDQRLRVVAMFLNAGIHDSDVLSHALVNLALEKYPSQEVADLLLSHGACVDQAGGSCLISAWRSNNLSLFRFLCSKLDNVEVASSCLAQACAEFYIPSTAEVNMIEVVTSLLSLEIPNDVLNLQLVKALRVTVQRKLDMILVHLLLSKNAKLIPVSAKVLYDACASRDDRVITEVFSHKPGHPIRLAAIDIVCSEESSEFGEDVRCLNLLLPDMETVKGIGCQTLANWIRQALRNRKSSDFLKSLLEKPRLTGSKLSSLLTDCDGFALRDLLVWAVKQPVSIVNTDAIAALIKYVLAGNSNVRPRSLTWDLDGSNSFVLMAMSYERPNLVPTLLAHGADPHVANADGKSALVVALERRYSLAAESLFSYNRTTNDGSFHAAMCSQYWKLMRWMVERGHSAVHKAPVYKHMTVLESFLRHNHEEQHLKTLAFTIKLLSEICKHENIWLAIPTHLSVALNSTRPYELTVALVENMPRRVINMSEPRFKDDRYYSTLSFVERDQCPNLKSGDKQALIQYLERQGFRRAYYAPEGVQPEDAINVPRSILQLEDDRQRLQAYTSKVCAVCMEKPRDESSFHSSISIDCKTIHSWNDEIICSNCLAQHIIANIFPDGPKNVAIADPRCWAQSCPSTFSHQAIQALIPTSLFTHYDATLLHQTLHATLSSARCANTTIQCPGGVWFDTSDLDEVTFFRCPVCDDMTCILCNQLYNVHSDTPCPAGQATKRAEENKVSEELVSKIAKECECGARIQKTEGCDHMTCRRCRREWCYECLVPYAKIRAGDNSAHLVSCKHYRSTGLRVRTMIR